jgi:hypothetical protein
MARKTGKPSWQLPKPAPVGTSRRATTVLVASAATLVVVLLIGIAVVMNSGDPVQASIAELRKAEAQRDVTQIKELTQQARQSAGDLEPVLASFVTALPRDKAAVHQSPGVDKVAHWQQVATAVAQRHAETPSGSTATNVARGGFRTATKGIVAAIDTYAAALSLPESQQSVFFELAARQRATAIAAWSVAATQLDQINIDAGNGHQHVYLKASPDDGAIGADTLPEGTR